MQHASLVHEPACTGIRQDTPFIIDSRHAYPIISLTGSHIVQPGESQRQRVLIVVDRYLSRPGHSPVNNSSAIQSGTSLDEMTIYQQADKFWIQVITGYLPLVEIAGMESQHMVQRLHHDGSIVQLHGPAIHKRLTGHVVCMGISLYLVHTVVLDIKVGNAKAGSYPHVMIVVFYDATHHFVQHSILMGKHLFLRRTRSLEFQPRIGTCPQPSTTVTILAVDMSRQGVRRRQLVHQPCILLSLRGIPGIRHERDFEWARIQQAALLRTQPHASLAVKADIVNIG